MLTEKETDAMLADSHRKFIQLLEDTKQLPPNVRRHLGDIDAEISSENKSFHELVQESATNRRSP